MRHIYSGPREKRLDLWVGLIGCILSNALLVSAAVALWAGPGWVPAAILVVANIATVILLSLTRGYVAMGIGLAFGALAALTIAEGIFAVIGLVVTAFTGGLETNYCGSYETVCIGSPAVAGALIVGCALFLIPAFFVLRGIHRRIH